MSTLGAMDGFVRQSAADWFPELGGQVDLAVISSQVRPSSSVVQYRLRSSTSPQSRTIFVKVYRPWDDRAVRPRIGVDSGMEVKARFESRGLDALWKLSQDCDMRAVRPLYARPEDGIVITEAFDGLAARNLRLDTIEESVTAGGSALAAAHQAVEPEFDHIVTPDDLQEVARALVDFLAETRGKSFLYRRIVDCLDDTRIDPDPMPSVGHGDCSLRNLLVAPDGGIAWIDGLFRYRLPALVDLATFTTTTKFTGLYMKRRPRDVTAAGRLAESFVAGYEAARPFDRSVLTAYELLILLDRQAATLINETISTTQRRVLLNLLDVELLRRLRAV